MAASVMITRVANEVLRSRIDSAFYAPEHIERERRLKQLGVERLVIGNIASLVTDGTHKTPTYVENGIPFLSATNIEAGAIHFSDHKWIARSEFVQLKAWNCSPVPNDILIAKSGSIGNAAVVPEHTPEFAVFESVAIVRCDQIAPQYLAAFLNSAVGQQEIRRQTKGAVIRHLHLEDLREVEVPEFNTDAQHYIGDKVRQAERLRERARKLDQDGLSLLTQALGETPSEWVGNAGFSGVLPSGAFRTRVKANELRGRVDPAGYHPELQAIAKRAQGAPNLFRPLLDLVDIATDDRSRINSTARLSIYVSVLHVDAGGFVDMDGASTHNPDSDGRLCSPGDILLSGINPAANRVGVCPSFTGIGACSPEFSILSTKDSIDPHYVAFALRSHVCLRQLVHLGQGTSSSRRRVEESELANVQVPLIEDSESVGRAMAIRQECIAASAALITAAKLLVEHLIEGRLTESDLITAQQALEAGDRSADRAILQGLRRGEAAGATPLFPDLDALYALLDETTKAGNG